MPTQTRVSKRAIRALMFPALSVVTVLLGCTPLLGFELWGIQEWCAVYFFGKLIARLKWGEASWDLVCLLHNVLSVVAGALSIYHWQESDGACNSLGGKGVLTILLQAAHSATDFMMYGDAMMKEPVFIAHHAVLLWVALQLPLCPGCYSTVQAITVGEFGSGALAVDFYWRKFGFNSRGLKRLLFFGGSRVVNLYFLYHILMVTPWREYYTLHSRGEAMQSDDELFTVNIPVCMITSVGGSGMMLIVNSITWFRMFGAYRKHTKKMPKVKGIKGKFIKFVDIQLALAFIVCVGMRLADQLVDGWTAPLGESETAMVLLVSVGLFLCEPTIMTLWSSAVAEAELDEAADEPERAKKE